jgi:hypothetical protein
MMMREFEILIWAVINSKEHLEDILKEKDP